MIKSRLPNLLNIESCFMNLVKSMTTKDEKDWKMFIKTNVFKTFRLYFTLTSLNSAFRSNYVPFLHRF